MKNLTIEEVEKITGCENVEMFGINTNVELEYEFILNFNDSNFGKIKGWIKDLGGKWNPDTKRWSLKTNKLPRYLVSIITYITK